MYKILVDASANFDLSIMNENIKIVPMQYFLNGIEHSSNCLETIEEMHIFYEKLRMKAMTNTSQVTPLQFYETFKPIIEEKKGIICITLAKGLSGTYGSALIAKQMIIDEYKDAEIEIVDSVGATIGIGIILEQVLNNMDLPLKENAQKARCLAKNLHYRFFVNDLMFLKRGGRISSATAVIGTMLKIKPILYFNDEGKLEVICKKHGIKQCIQYFAEEYKKGVDKSNENNVYIAHSDNLELANLLKKEILKINNEATVKIVNLCPIVGSHTGPGMLGIVHAGLWR